MAFNVKNEEADRLARSLAEVTGESLTEAVMVALRERLERERSRRGLATRVHRLVGEVAEYRVIDSRTTDQILGYDEAGLPR